MLKRFQNKNVQSSGGGLVAAPEEIYLARVVRRLDWKRLFFIFLGVAIFCLVYFSPPLPDAIDPKGEHFHLSREGKAALGLFLLAAFWWVFEVIPIGVTSITIGSSDFAFNKACQGRFRRFYASFDLVHYRICDNRNGLYQDRFDQAHGL